MNAATDRHAAAVAVAGPVATWVRREGDAERRTIAAAARRSEVAGAVSAVFGPRRGRAEEIPRA